MKHTSYGITIDHVALGILRHEDSVVLVQQQTPNEARPYWVLPGGLVEASELITDALVREVREEAGAQVTAIGRLVCVSQIDRPAECMQTVTFLFEVEQWHGDLQHNDPDAEILSVELVPLAEAIARLEANGGWPGIQGPLQAYLRGECKSGTAWFYREDDDGQHLVTRLMS